MKWERLLTMELVVQTALMGVVVVRRKVLKLLMKERSH
jgi:hypothetical protein